MRIESSFPSEIAERAVSLADAHVAEVGFAPIDALAVLEHIRQTSSGILGADMWKETGDGFHVPAHMGVAVRLHHDESWEAFVVRSTDEGAAAIRRFAALPTEGRWLVALTGIVRSEWELARLRTQAR
jgi:hypothetical protein